MRTEQEKQDLIERYHKEIAEIQSTHDNEKVGMVA